MTATLSPAVGDFVRERCVIGKTKLAKYTELYGAWTLYCLDRKHADRRGLYAFERDLHDAVGELHVILLDDGELWSYLGLALKR